MSGTRGMGRRRGARGKTEPVNGIPEGVIVNHEPAHAATQVIEPIPAPSLAQDLAEGPKAAELGLTDIIYGLAYVHEPIPDLYSADPADRTEWFLLAGGAEPLFEATVRDLGAEWLLDTSLPVPPRTAPGTTEAPTDSGPESTPPPGGESAAETTAPDPSPEPSGPVSTEDGEPDEPVAEADCGAEA